jgi:SAM-dependent methyltransferase
MRSAIYDALISPMTRAWYAAVLQRVPHGARVLDVGVGTGMALVANRDLLIASDVRVTGIDIDPTYVDAARSAVDRAGLDDRVEVLLESVYDHRGGPYDGIYFSASFMLLPDPAAALAHVLTLLRPGGVLYFTQTFEHRRSPAMERVKPLLRLLTSIDFGQVTYEAPFLETLTRGGLRVVENVVLQSKSRQSYRLIAAIPDPSDRGPEER